MTCKYKKYILLNTGSSALVGLCSLKKLHEAIMNGFLRLNSVPVHIFKQLLYSGGQKRY